MVQVQIEGCRKQLPFFQIEH